jgi:hypothetical protein
MKFNLLKIEESIIITIMIMDTYKIMNLNKSIYKLIKFMMKIIILKINSLKSYIFNKNQFNNNKNKIIKNLLIQIKAAKKSLMKIISKI